MIQYDSICKSTSSGFGDTVIDEALAKEMAIRGTFVISTLSVFGAFQGKDVGSQLAADARLAPYLTPAQRKELVNVGPGPDHPLAPYPVRFDVEQAKKNPADNYYLRG